MQEVWQIPEPENNNQQNPISSGTLQKPRRLSSTDPHILTNRKIPIVSTSVSSLESLSVEVFHPSPDTHHQNTMDHLREEARIIKEEAKVLQSLRRRLVREMKEFPEEDICTHRITVMERDLNVIKEIKNVYQDAVEDFIDKFRERLEEDSSVLASWVNDVSAIAQEVRTHANKLRAKKESLFQNQHMSTHQRSLEIQEASLKLQELTLQEKKDSTATKEKEKAAEDLVLAETEANFFLGECSVLGDIMAGKQQMMILSVVL